MRQLPFSIFVGKVYNHLDEDVKTFVHVHSQTPFGGIYHAKFVLITTDQCLRFIVMTTNITNQMVENCENDYYILDIPKSAKVRTKYTQNEMILKKYLEYMKICTNTSKTKCVLSKTILKMYLDFPGGSDGN